MAETETSYCVKCRSKQEVKDPVLRETSTGRKMVQATCTACGTKTNRAVSNAQAEQYAKATTG